MSIVVSEFPPQQHRKHEWEKWCDGQIHQLERGVDFDCAARALVRAAQRWADYHNIALKTRVRGDRCWLQFTRRHQLRSIG